MQMTEGQLADQFLSLAFATIGPSLDAGRTVFEAIGWAVLYACEENR